MSQLASVYATACGACLTVVFLSALCPAAAHAYDPTPEQLIEQDLRWRQSYRNRSASLTFGFWGSAGRECNPEAPSYYVGGEYSVCVTLWPPGLAPDELLYEGVTYWSWPRGLSIIVNDEWPEDTRRQIRDSLQMVYYVTDRQANCDVAWRTTGIEPGRSGTRLEYYFAFRVPQELAGTNLCLTARWNHPKYGRLDCGKYICIPIVEPCSEVAQHDVWTSQVKEAYEQRKYELSVARAEYFVTRGWHDFWGLSSAILAARRLGWTERAAGLKELLDMQPIPEMEY